MSISLTIDQGNSSAKVAVWNERELLSYASYTTFGDEELAKILGQHDVTRAMFCSVAGQQEQLSAMLRDAGIKVLELSTGTHTPLIIDYATPATLGVDRIAAAVGAYKLHPGSEILVVDIGTAATYDRVTARGHFVGGNIAPGVGMRLRALHNYTARLPLVSSRGETRLWGNSTESALRSGAFIGVVAEISYYRWRLSSGAKVVITGGWGKEIASMLDFETDYQETLVNMGLNELLIYNET